MLLTDLVNDQLGTRRLTTQEAIAELDKELAALKRNRNKAKKVFASASLLADKISAQRQVREIDQQITAWHRAYFDRQDEIEAEEFGS
jgi:nucleoid-associated protein YejK